MWTKTDPYNRSIACPHWRQEREAVLPVRGGDNMAFGEPKDPYRFSVTRKVRSRYTVPHPERQDCIWDRFNRLIEAGVIHPEGYRRPIIYGERHTEIQPERCDNCGAEVEGEKRRCPVCGFCATCGD